MEQTICGTVWWFRQNTLCTHSVNLDLKMLACVYTIIPWDLSVCAHAVLACVCDIVHHQHLQIQYFMFTVPSSNSGEIKCTIINILRLSQCGIPHSYYANHCISTVHRVVMFVLKKDKLPSPIEGPSARGRVKALIDIPQWSTFCLKEKKTKKGVANWREERDFALALSPTFIFIYKLQFKSLGSIWNILLFERKSKEIVH